MYVYNMIHLISYVRSYLQKYNYTYTNHLLCIQILLWYLKTTEQISKQIEYCLALHT